MMDPIEQARAAQALAAAEAAAKPIAPLTEASPAMTVEDAYEIQLLNINRRLRRGRSVAGYKVGLTSRAMQQQLGVDEPDYGHLLDDMIVPEDSVVAAGGLCSPRVEFEIAFVLGQPLGGPSCTAADVLRATEFVLPAIEIIDSRIEDWRIKLPDTIADNASAAGVVLGGNPTRLEAIDVRGVDVTVEQDGEHVLDGRASAVLGNPVNAVAWLVRTLHRLGVSCEPGHVVMPGSCTAALDVGPGSSIRAEFTALGPVALSFS